MTKVSASILEPGTIVLYYNRWTGYENPSIKDYFREATQEEIQALKPGDLFWMKDDPHPNGKVYGFAKVILSRLDGNRVHYGSHGNFFTIDPCNRVLFVEDETPLVEAIAANPLVSDVIGDGGRALARVMGLI